jgi:hypothetical protein
MASKLLYVYNYITKLCKQEAEFIQSYTVTMYAILDNAKPDTENIRRLNSAAVRHVTGGVRRLPL